MTDYDSDNEGRCAFTADGIQPRPDGGMDVLTRRCVLQAHETGDHVIELPNGKPLQIARRYP
ncbi:hypothetical protein L5G28_07550 [Gordonia sp. HY285]|uniref:hypothetical protein n=1 Tax=Gordonia liuliyuniae TaxID=2911517 RepID=UPI001F2DCEEC|nr:hypothetical protein [Gordonia liuliyuniae]MCF8610015.1 hypothetical protein [Gordonia liuliyuniae]